MFCEKLEWGDEQQLSYILEKHPEGFDLILGADICYQQDSLSPLFKTVKSLLSHKSCSSKQFILSYVSRARSIDAALLKEAKKHELEVGEIAGTRASILNGVMEGTLFRVTLPS
ncbi:hypothetical protein L7F22_044785, partial [Adiantum nelumboides]|nr:hypothetical protein [Adiantum nelumboides]